MGVIVRKGNFDGNPSDRSVMLMDSTGRFISGISNLDLQEMAPLGSMDNYSHSKELKRLGIF